METEFVIVFFRHRPNGSHTTVNIAAITIMCGSWLAQMAWLVGYTMATTTSTKTTMATTKTTHGAECQRIRYSGNVVIRRRLFVVPTLRVVRRGRFRDA